MSSPEQEKEAGLKAVADAGFPPINAFTTDLMNGKLLKAFMKKEVAVVAG